MIFYLIGQTEYKQNTEIRLNQYQIWKQVYFINGVHQTTEPYLLATVNRGTTSYTDITVQQLPGEDQLDLGYDVKFINFDLYKGKLKELYNGFKDATGNGNPIDLIKSINVALLKIDLLDRLEHKLAYYRPRELQIGSADIRYNRGVKAIETVLTPTTFLLSTKISITESSIIVTFVLITLKASSEYNLRSD